MFHLSHALVFTPVDFDMWNQVHDVMGHFLGKRGGMSEGTDSTLISDVKRWLISQSTDKA